MADTSININSSNTCSQVNPLGNTCSQVNPLGNTCSQVNPLGNTCSQVNLLGNKENKNNKHIRDTDTKEITIDNDSKINGSSYSKTRRCEDRTPIVNIYKFTRDNYSKSWIVFYVILLILVIIILFLLYRKLA
jgi:hypothetical protein